MPGAFLYGVARLLFFVLFGVFFPLEFIGADVIRSAEGPYILISNHNCYLDPVILVRLCPKRIRFLVKKELLSNAFLAWCIRMAECIPVDREGRDASAFRECLKVLGDGGILGVFPEGTRFAGGMMENPKTGVAMMALLKGVDIIPVYIDGKPRLFRKTKVITGKVIGGDDRPQGPVSAKNVGLINDLIKERYTALKEELCKE